MNSEQDWYQLNPIQSSSNLVMHSEPKLTSLITFAFKDEAAVSRSSRVETVADRKKEIVLSKANLFIKKPPEQNKSLVESYVLESSRQKLVIDLCEEKILVQEEYIFQLELKIKKLESEMRILKKLYMDKKHDFYEKIQPRLSLPSENLLKDYASNVKIFKDLTENRSLTNIRTENTYIVEDPLENNKTITTLHNNSTEKYIKSKNITKINLDNFDINKNKIENIKTTKYQTESVDKYQTESVNKYQAENVDKTKDYTENIYITEAHAENTIGNILHKGIINIAENHVDNADLSRGHMENISIIKVANFLFKSEISPETEIKKNENGYNYIKRNIQNDFINFEKNLLAHLSKDLQVKVDNEFLKLSLKLTKSFMDSKLPKKTVQNTEIINNSSSDVKYGIQNKLKSSEIIDVRRKYLFDIELNAIKMNLELSKVESLVNHMTSQVV